jgi:hypothetical protein
MNFIFTSRWPVLLFAISVWAADKPAVTLTRTPGGGIQPQVAVGDNGVRHLIYFKGDAAAGDIFYVRDNAEPLRVNSQPGSAIATGTIRGAQIALGRNGRVHVAWNGSRTAEPKAPDGSSPMLYARLNDAGTAFEAQRNLLYAGGSLDGGGTLAADSGGNVWVAWHARGAEKGEEHRRVYISRSRDDGRTFDRDAPVDMPELGACSCCGMRAVAVQPGLLFMLFRAATNSVHRDMVLLASDNAGRSFRATVIDRWNLNACPMSSEAANFANGRIAVAWQTEKQVYFALVDPATGAAGPRIAAPGEGSRKFPALAMNSRGETLLAWAEGTGWQKGGSLAWQVYDKSGKPTAEHGEAPGVPTWSFPAAFAGTDGRFTIVY